MVVEPEPFMKIYPEFKMPPEQSRRGWPIARARSSASTWRSRFDWKVGDRIPIVGTIWQPKQGQVWDFNIVGIYDGEPGVDKTQFFFRYDYLEREPRAAARAWSAGTW